MPDRTHVVNIFFRNNWQVVRNTALISFTCFDVSLLNESVTK